MASITTQRYTPTTGPRAYGKVFKLLHWSMAFLVLFALAVIELKDSLTGDALKHKVTVWHVEAGLCVFLLIWARIAWRLTNPVPTIFPPLSRIQALASKLAHFSLYILMLSLPIGGILARQSKGNPVEFFGYLLPSLVDEDKALPYALSLGNIHAYMGNILIN